MWYKGKLIGDVEILNNILSNGGCACTYSLTVRCASKEGKLIYINKDDFLKLQRQTETWNTLVN